MSFLPHGRIVKKGAFLRYATDRFAFDDGQTIHFFRARGKIRLRAKYVGDIDHGDFRAFNTRGWKSHKHRYQWEHNVIEAEKHKKNRRRKEAGRERPVSIENDR